MPLTATIKWPSSPRAHEGHRFHHCSAREKTFYNNTLVSDGDWSSVWLLSVSSLSRTHHTDITPALRSSLDVNESQHHRHGEASPWERDTVLHTGATAGPSNVDVVGTLPYYHCIVVNVGLRASQGPSTCTVRAILTHPTPRGNKCGKSAITTHYVARPAAALPRPRIRHPPIHPGLHLRVTSRMAVGPSSRLRANSALRTKPIRISTSPWGTPPPKTRATATGRRLNTPGQAWHLQPWLRLRDYSTAVSPHKPCNILTREPEAARGRGGESEGCAARSPRMSHAGHTDAATCSVLRSLRAHITVWRPREEASRHQLL